MKSKPKGRKHRNLNWQWHCSGVVASLLGFFAVLIFKFPCHICYIAGVFMTTCSQHATNCSSTQHDGIKKAKAVQGREDQMGNGSLGRSVWWGVVLGLLEGGGVTLLVIPNVRRTRDLGGRHVFARENETAAYTLRHTPP